MRRIAPASAMLAIVLAACAPDAWRSDSPYQAFLTQVQNKCYYKNLGGTTVSEVLNAPDPYFLDETSRVFNGRITRANYVSALQSRYVARSDDPGIDCVVSLLPTGPVPGPGQSVAPPPGPAFAPAPPPPSR